MVRNFKVPTDLNFKRAKDTPFFKLEITGADWPPKWGAISPIYTANLEHLWVLLSKVEFRNLGDAQIEAHILAEVTAISHYGEVENRTDGEGNPIYDMICRPPTVYVFACSLGYVAFGHAGLIEQTSNNELFIVGRETKISNLAAHFVLRDKWEHVYFLPKTAFRPFDSVIRDCHAFFMSRQFLDNSILMSQDMDDFNIPIGEY